MNWCRTISLLLIAMIAVGEAGGQQTPTAAGKPAHRDRRQRRRDRSLRVLMTLNRPISAIEFDEEPFEDVLDWFREQGLPNIIVKWQKLEDYGDVERLTPVTLRAENLVLGEVLDLVLDYVSQASVKEARLHYQIYNGLIMISTRDDFADQLIVRTYDIEHLLQKLVFYKDSPVIEVTAGGGDGSGGGNSGGGSGGGGNGRGGGQGNGGRPGPGGPGDGGGIIQGGGDERIDYEANREEMVAKLLDIIRSIQPETWKENGGRGIVKEFQGKLVITQTVEVHEIIGGTVRQGVGR